MLIRNNCRNFGYTSLNTQTSNIKDLLIPVFSEIKIASKCIHSIGYTTDVLTKELGLVAHATSLSYYNYSVMLIPTP